MKIILDILMCWEYICDCDQPNWLLGFIQTILGAGIGAWATVWVLFKSIKQDKQKEEDKKIEKQKEKLLYFQSLILNINKVIVSQIENFKTFSDDIKANPFELHPLKYAILNDLEIVVHKINQEKYFHSYLTQFGREPAKVEEFREIFLIMYFFDGTITIIKNTLQKPFDLDYQRKIELATLIDDIKEEVSNCLVNVKLQTEQKSFLKYLNDKTKEYNEDTSNRTDIPYFIDMLINKIKSDELNSYSTSIREAESLRLKLKTASQNYERIKLNNIRLAETFDKHRENFEKEYNNLQPQIKRIEKYKG